MDIPQNMTRSDAGIRYTLGFALWLVAASTFFDAVPMWGAIAAFALGAVLLLTAAARFCPLYAALGIGPTAARRRG